MRATRIPASALAHTDPAELTEAVLLAPVQLIRGMVRKGTRIDWQLAHELVAAARSNSLRQPVRVAWPDPDDLHEDEAADRLAAAATGPGIERCPPRQSRLDLVAGCDGVLHVRIEGLTRINTIDSLELFTLFNGQPVQRGQVVASVKVAPHLIPAGLVEEGIRVARESAPLIEVRPFLALDVGALVAESIPAAALARFEAGARTRVEALGGRFVGTTVVSDADPDVTESEARDGLAALVITQKLPVILVGGVPASDPLAPFYAALQSLGGRVLRHGVPAHPGSMIWLAELGESQLLGLPQCGMFSLATAADLILPRLLTGERLTAERLAELAHGGVLTREMRFRFPLYARDLEAKA